MQGAYLSGKEKGQVIANDLMRTRNEEDKAGYLFGDAVVHEEL